MNNLINNAASDMSVHWNKTNRAFTDRISECQDAHRNLKSNLILTKNVSTTFSTSCCSNDCPFIIIMNHVQKYSDIVDLCWLLNAMQKRICTLSFVCFLRWLQSCRYLFDMIVLENTLQILGLKLTILHGKIVH